jgi:hypothetical protein
MTGLGQQKLWDGRRLRRVNSGPHVLEILLPLFPKNGRKSVIAVGPFRATSGSRYSITRRRERARSLLSHKDTTASKSPNAEFGLQLAHIYATPQK